MPRSWIFQASPKTFRIDDYLLNTPQEMLFLVRRYGAEIALGDQVFIWRAAGDDGVSGIIAEAEVLGPIADQPSEPASIPYWIDPTLAHQPAPRVPLRIRRTAGSRQILRRDWMKDDPVLRSLMILRMASGTNFPVTDAERDRLNDLWRKTGVDWNRSEAVAGLWAYSVTRGQEVSRLAGSPIAQVALTIGRAVTGVYNKVMNFRHLDPTDPRQGMSGGSATDAAVWAEFFDEDSQQLRAQVLEEEFRRLWPGSPEEGALDQAEASDAALRGAVKKLTITPVEELIKRYEIGLTGRSSKPNSRAATTRQFERDALVIAIAKSRAGFRCEIPDCPHPTFLSDDGNSYCEVHHIRPLAEGGEDTIENVVCLCPAHHREAHHGAARAELAASFRRVRQG
jgi:hypothetical protein